jgi:hypothetical protein
MRWMVRWTWLTLAVNLAAVYGMKLSHGQWPLSHPYSGVGLLFAYLVFISNYQSL